MGPSESSHARTIASYISSGRWIDPAALGLTVVGVLLGLAYIATLGPATDAGAYAIVSLDDPYLDSRTWGDSGAYLYSPAFAQATEPLRWLGPDLFTLAWRLVNLAVLVAMTGPLAGPLLFVPAVAGELRAANVHLLLAGAIVLGFRWPGAWALVLLTKVTPGVALIWFAVRREWRALGLALAATAAVAAVSATLAPGLWADWMSLLASTQPAQPEGPALIPWPLAPRLVAAAALVAWGARTDRRWTVPVAASLMLPALWVAGLSVMVAAIPLAWSDRRPFRLPAWRPLGKNRRRKGSRDPGVAHRCPRRSNNDP